MKRYLQDYEGFNEYEYEVFKMPAEEKAELVSQNPISAFRMLRRFGNVHSIMKSDLKLQISKGNIR